MKKQIINWADFEKIDIRTGTIIEAKLFKEATKPAIKLKIDFGEIGILQSSAQITDLYTHDDLLGKQIIAIVNFPPKQIANYMSECLVLGSVDANHQVVLLATERNVDNGLKIS